MNAAPDKDPQGPPGVPIPRRPDRPSLMSSTAFPPFSKVRVANGLAYLSGELPIAENGGVPDGIAAQTDLTLRRIGASLEAIGLALADVVQVTVYLADPADFNPFNAAYGRHFAEPRPARTTIVAGLVFPGARVEITVVAAERRSNRARGGR
jgi:2-iminobutanoate/2-iminopropanoate deaminase